MVGGGGGSGHKANGSLAVSQRWSVWSPRPWDLAAARPKQRGPIPSGLPKRPKPMTETKGPAAPVGSVPCYPSPESGWGSCGSGQGTTTLGSPLTATAYGRPMAGDSITAASPHESHDDPSGAREGPAPKPSLEFQAGSPKDWYAASLSFSHTLNSRETYSTT